ncbi:MAG: glycosyltransferase [Pseudomonadota bacterium]
MRVLFYVLHLQGIGHVVRSTRICAQLAEEGCDVTLVLGGMPIDGFEAGKAKVVQLPPLRMAPDSYRVLRKENGEPVDDAYKAARMAQLSQTLHQSNPQAVLVEAFPFDRPQMHFEIIPFLEAARQRCPRPIIVSSIRDILQTKAKPERDANALDNLNKLFDFVMIHGDPQVATLDETFRHTDEIKGKVHYTGIVSPVLPSEPAEKVYDVVVSAGGGATGEAILKAAISAKPHTPLKDKRWVATLGPHSEDAAANEIRSMAAAQNVEVVPFLNELAAHLSTADFSISQAGYNTAADILLSGCTSVMCPYSGIRQNEQPQRAEKFEKLGLAKVVSEQDLSSETLIAAIHAALAMPKSNVKVDLNGASNTVRILRDLVTRH